MIRPIYIEYIERKYKHLVIDGERTVQHMLMIAVVETQRVDSKFLIFVVLTLVYQLHMHHFFQEVFGIVHDYVTGGVGDGEISLGGQLGRANDLVLTGGSQSISLNSGLSGGGQRQRHVFGELATNKLTYGRMSFVFGPWLIVLLPCDQTQITYEADSSVIAWMSGLVIEAGLSQSIGQHPFVVHMRPLIKRSPSRCLTAHISLVKRVSIGSSIILIFFYRVHLNAKQKYLNQI